MKCKNCFSCGYQIEIDDWVLKYDREIFCRHACIHAYVDKLAVQSPLTEEQCDDVKEK